MALLETQNFLAQIYTDEKLRREFLSEPEKIGGKNNLKPEEIAELIAIFPAELNAFAESLFYKRLRQVEKLLPLMRRLTGKNFEEHFRRFANHFSPESNKKHLEDAIKFADFLQFEKNETSVIKNAAKFERARLEFNAFQKRFAVILLDYDVRLISDSFLRENETSSAQNLALRKTVVIWLRTGNKVKQFVF
jgi:hypothetical protein